MGAVLKATPTITEHANGTCGGTENKKIWCVCRKRPLWQLAWNIEWVYEVLNALPPPPRPPSARTRNQVEYYIGMSSYTKLEMYDYRDKLVREEEFSFPTEYWHINNKTLKSEPDCHGTPRAYVPYYRCKMKSIDKVSLNLYVPYYKGSDDAVPRVEDPSKPPPPPFHTHGGRVTRFGSTVDPKTGERTPITYPPRPPEPSDPNVEFRLCEGETKTEEAGAVEDHCTESPLWVHDWQNDLIRLVMRAFWPFGTPTPPTGGGSGGPGGGGGQSDSGGGKIHNDEMRSVEPVTGGRGLLPVTSSGQGTTMGGDAPQLLTERVDALFGSSGGHDSDTLGQGGSPNPLTESQ